MKIERTFKSNIDSIRKENLIEIIRLFKLNIKKPESSDTSKSVVKKR